MGREWTIHPSTMLLMLWLLILCFGQSHTNPLASNQRLIAHLQKYGYLEVPNTFRPRPYDEDDVKNALMDFQRFAGLPQNGELNDETLAMMATPRCGVKDVKGTQIARRRKRYSIQRYKWRIGTIKYRISKYPTRINKQKDREKLHQEIARAFKVWSDVTNLRFEERKNRAGRVHIDLRFESRDHGDADPFDGAGGDLAHAFPPTDRGDIHFDNEESWSLIDGEGKNVFRIAAHEIGHSLGLLHSDDADAFMWQYYRQNVSDVHLTEDDVHGIQTLYGKVSAPDTSELVNDDGDPAGPQPDQSQAPDLCRNGSFDAIVKTQNGNTYLFKGDYYWKLLSDGLAQGYPRRISEDWGGLPGNLDAAFTWSTNKTFFFKDRRYWRFTNRQMDPNYPKLIRTGFEGIPNDIDAAFVWSGNGKTYFFKGDSYWRYDSKLEPPVSAKYPKLIIDWNGLPDNIDAAFQRKDRKTYFFKGGQYYRFDDATFAVDEADPPYPRSTSIWWFDCQPQ